MLFILGGEQDIMAFMDGTVLSTCKMNDTQMRDTAYGKPGQYNVGKQDMLSFVDEI